MEEKRSSHPAGELALIKLRKQKAADSELPDDFVPLRLVLLPSKLSVDLTRPEMLIGRHTEADIPLPLADVSRRHCRLVFAQSQWHVFDLKSLNGTFVNNRRVEQSILQTGDRVRVGGFTFEVHIQPLKVRKPVESTPKILQTIDESSVTSKDLAKEKRRAS